MGTALQTISTRKKKAYRMFPVVSAMRPTTRGPMNELDLSVIEKSPYLEI